MTPVVTANTTTVLGAPINWDSSKHGPCMGLPIVKTDDCYFSYWQPSWKERLSVLFGKPVRLAVFSHGHPPVGLDTLT